MRRRWSLAGVVLTLGLLLALALPAAPRADRAAPGNARLDPGTFADLATGVVLVRGFDCSGVARISGTGFLVGSSVVMTARHVVDPAGAEAKFACHVKVRLDGRWVTVARESWWHGSGDPTGRSTDLATLKLPSEADPGDHIFSFRSSSPPAGTQVSMLGYPLGGGISLTQGRLLSKIHLRTVPLLLIDLLGAEGASGSPIVDNNGNVVGVLQLGLGGKDILGQRTSGVIAGIDILGWWGSGQRAETRLCQVYPNGGISGCEGSTTSSPPSSPPPTSSPPSQTTTPPAGWLPSGFSIWDGDGDYTAGTIGWQYGDCNANSQFATSCWSVNIVTANGCNSDAFVNVDLFDSAGNVVDSGIDELPAVQPGQVVNAHGDTFSADATSFRVTRVDCFNF